MSLVVQFENQGAALLVRGDADHATFECDFAAPPGSLRVGTIVGSNYRVQLKVRDCRRIRADSPQYQLRGRWVSLTRAAREELIGSLADSKGP